MNLHSYFLYTAKLETSQWILYQTRYLEWSAICKTIKIINSSTTLQHLSVLLLSTTFLLKWTVKFLLFYSILFVLNLIVFFFKVYFYELRRFIIPTLSAIGFLTEKLGLDLGSPFFWLQRHAFEIAKTRIEQRVR